MNKTCIIIASLMIFLQGCTFVGTNETIKPHEKETINISETFYMVHPKNGIEQTYFAATAVTNETSAKDATAVFHKKFYKKFGGLVISDLNVSLDQGFKTAQTRGDKYLISMDINEWKDAFYMTCAPSKQQGQMSTLNQAKDSVDITINIYDVNTKKLLNKQRVQNNGCPIVFLAVIPVGKMTPNSRFNSSLDEWLENLETTSED